MGCVFGKKQSGGRGGGGVALQERKGGSGGDASALKEWPGVEQGDDWIACPKKHFGLILGTHGARARRLEEKHGVTMNADGSQQRITFSGGKAKACKDWIANLLQGDYYRNQEHAMHRAKNYAAMEAAQQRTTDCMFAFHNWLCDKDEIDLHGLYVEPALAKVASVKTRPLTVITGKGLHSDKKGPKIRPALIAHLKESGQRYEEGEGTIVIQ